ncbi:MAG TPA: efflux RND transporter permease subunit [Planctomycetes bacterium]|nr:efflux RND transporter permease subunit [Planctomycetota bacterium]
MKGFIDWVVSRPRIVAAFALAIVLGGVVGFSSIPLNLFPDTNRPVVRVVTRWPGAASDDVATEVTHPLEVRLSGLDGVRRVTSTSMDQVSAISVEFEYGTSIGDAATDVSNELPRVTSLLPPDVQSPVIFKVTEAAQPVLTLAVRSGEDAHLDLGEVRRIAENALRDRILEVPGVADAEVFGGEVRRVSVELDRDALQAHGLTVAQVASALESSNVSIPSGLIRSEGDRRLLTTQALAKGPEDLAATLVQIPGGDFVRVGDLGTVSWGAEPPTSVFRGNGEAAVAVAILRAENGHADEVLASFEEALPGLQSEFPSLDLEVADTQGRLIDLTVDNMLSSLRDAVVMTIIVLLLLIGNSRAAFVTALSLPLTYLVTFAAMALLGFEFDMVTLTAIIIAVGLLADDAVVVIENIERRMRDGEDGMTAAREGTKEILLADASGTVSTVLVLIPILFIGGYVQTVLRPLCTVLSIALFASLIVSVTIIPLLASRFLRPGAWDPLGFVFRPFQRFLLDPIKRFYAFLLGRSLGHRALVLLFFLVLLVGTGRAVMPILGRELMPLMDTGVMSIHYEADPNADDTEMADLAARIEEKVRAEVPSDWILSMSNVIGSEPDVKSIGAGQTLSKGALTVNLVDRFRRDRSMQDIERGLRARLHRVPGLISVNVFEFGATPLSSLRGTVDVMVSGPDPAVLSSIAEEILARLSKVRGLTGVERSWQDGSERLRLDVDPETASLHGMSAGQVAHQVGAAVSGMPAGRLRVRGENPYPVWVRLRHDQRTDPEDLLAIDIVTPARKILPVASLATIHSDSVPTAETHQGLLPTVDVIGFRRNVAVTHLQGEVVDALSDLDLPRGYSIRHEGEIKQMNESFKRLAISLGLGLLALYLMLVVTFRSFLDPLAILGTLPLALIGANWAMLIADKHGCLPSFMGLILLMGIVVNNGILLIDVTKERIAAGSNLREALIESVHLRTRPILMTAGASAVGMIPIALEWAVGVERLSPLAVVAIGGLIAGTFLTLLVVPLLFHAIESMRRRFRRVPRNG